MKVTITGKGDGFVDVRYEADSPIEAMVLSTCPLDTADAALEMKTEQIIMDYSTMMKSSKTWLTFHGWRVKAHEIVQSK